MQQAVASTQAVTVSSLRQTSIAAGSYNDQLCAIGCCWRGALARNACMSCHESVEEMMLLSYIIITFSAVHKQQIWYRMSDVWSMISIASGHGQIQVFVQISLFVDSQDSQDSECYHFISSKTAFQQAELHKFGSLSSSHIEHVVMIQAHPDVPVVDSLEDIWLVNKLQAERKATKQAQERSQQLKQYKQARLVLFRPLHWHTTSVSKKGCE